MQAFVEMRCRAPRLFPPSWPCEGSQRQTELLPDGIQIQIQREDGVPAHGGKAGAEDSLLRAEAESEIRAAAVTRPQGEEAG